MANEQTLIKKVDGIANVLSSAGIGYTDYLTQLTYILFLKMDSEKEKLGLKSLIPDGYKWQDICNLSGEDLVEKYEEILKIDGVVGLNIATRSDSITNECLDYLEELSKRTFLTVELGLQTIHEKTNKLINRGETLQEFEEMVKKLRKRKINVVVHIINGLPYENKQDMLETTNYINNLDIQGIKIHMLHIIKNTKLEELFNKEKFHVLTRDEYVNIVCDELEIIRPEIVINRITGDPNPDELIEPKWLIKKFGVLNEIDKEMAKRNTYQGSRVE